MLNTAIGLVAPFNLLRPYKCLQGGIGGSIFMKMYLYAIRYFITLLFLRLACQRLVQPPTLKGFGLAANAS